MTTADELDELLHDRLDMDRDDLISALRALQPQHHGSTRLTAVEAGLLDSYGLTEDTASYAENAVGVIALMGRLYSTALSPADVAKGMQVSDSRLRQRRLNRTLWALDDGGTWVYPAVQFDLLDGPDSAIFKHIRGLDQVLAHLLDRGLHPTAVARFLTEPQSELLIDGQPRSVREWLLSGESVNLVLHLIEVGDWAGA